MKDNIEVLLDDAGARWRSGLPEPGEPDWPGITTRSKTPLWIAATAVAAALVVTLTVVLWPSNKDERPAHPVPVAGLLVPAPKGAIVPAPHIVPHSNPVGSYCPSWGLTGSVILHYTVGELRLSIRPGIHKNCNLPGMLTGSTVPRLIDDTGRVRAVGSDPSAQFSVNPPYFGKVVLRPGQTATMYLRTKGEPLCLPGGSHAVIKYLGSELVLPVTGSTSCTNSAKQTSFWYGPFSTPGHAVAFEPVDWTNLSAALHFPATMPASGTVRFQVTLTNRSRTRAATLSSCPRFGMVISSNRTSSWPEGTMQCSNKPVVIQPGHSHRFAVDYQQNRLQAGDYRVEWAIPGSKTAYATTTVR